jgi:uncharacterized protein
MYDKGPIPAPYVHTLMRFVWDEEKNQKNQLKHGVSFELASLVFDDPYGVSVPDDCETEERWLTTGLVRGVVIILVVHTSEEQEEYEETIRIISARKATQHERKAYENQHRKA